MSRDLARYPDMVPQEILTLLDLLTRPEFLAGAAAGLGALCLFLFTPAERLPGWGIALSVATLAAIFATVGQRLSLASGLVALAVGGHLIERGNRDGSDTRATTAIGWIVIVVGASMVAARGGRSDLAWAAWATPVVVVGLGSCLSTWRSDPLQRLVGPLVAVTAFGIWSTVPDTNLARALLGASIPLAVATLPPIGARIVPAGAYALAGLITFVTVDGGFARQASVIGGWASAGMLVLVPAVALVTGRRHHAGATKLAVLHVLLVLVAARVIGLWERAVPAVIATTVVWMLVGWGMALRPRTRA